MSRSAHRYAFNLTDAHFNQEPAVSWLGSDGKPARVVGDRFTAQYLVKDEAGTVQPGYGPLAERGLELLSLRDAIILGFTTSEYHAALRVQMLRGELLGSEEELAAELIPPADFSEAVDRELCTDEPGEWPGATAAGQVPYPSEDLFQDEKAVGWATTDGRLLKESPADRFNCLWLVRDTSTNQLRLSACTIAQVGIESLSIKDAIKLGFTTMEYRTALRVRLFERRHLRDEQDLARSMTPPRDVQLAFNRHGRLFLEPENRDVAWGYHMWDVEGPARRWMQGSSVSGDKPTPPPSFP
ncbi:hypothetical protein [Sinorhizobium meliloti]|uniref:hypothetical protein n=1 Tax=Rhizobium meliloti TaxID=382 RepID=UPI000FD6E4F2|nr:hypothetical protein [Sinorhizobium meliloti]MDW9928073.1 hypothetical protein [Sinorhizobium meliloti]MDX0964804.1 hypothetical protein [Sinorhizobium medicae]RVI54953.1 hypothetical protein CN195_04875 [Sinorhizobium meliloti]